jgi:hypothetical protein
LEKVRCFRIRRLLGFLPNVQGKKLPALNLYFMALNAQIALKLAAIMPIN